MLDEVFFLLMNVHDCGGTGSCFILKEDLQSNQISVFNSEYFNNDVKFFFQHFNVGLVEYLVYYHGQYKLRLFNFFDSGMNA